jgi:UDP-3-O-[3-hydroxymyristoyl] glucosamine N-acyltransferase
MSEVLASDIARLLGAPLVGQDFLVTGISSKSSPRPNTVSFRTESLGETPLKAPALLLVPLNLTLSATEATLIGVAHPREAYAEVVDRFFAPRRIGIAASAVIGADAQLGVGVSIGEKAVIEDNVSIGNETIVDHGAIIGWGTTIGSRCRIGANVVIGHDGLGTFETTDGRLRNVRHLGRVHIGDDVEIGALCAIARGTIDQTEIGDNTHIGPMVNVGHNVIIGKRCQIAGRTHLSGSVVVEDGARLWANCTIRDGVKIGAGATVGMSASVGADVAENQVVATLPAITLKKLASFVQKFKWGR